MITERDVRVKYRAVLEINGREVFDYRLAGLLREIGREGSLLKASKKLGVPYSRAWELIVRAERVLGEQLIETMRGGRGGGGTRLTKLAYMLLELYERAESKLRKLGLTSLGSRGVYVEPDIIIAYSHDPLLELLIGLIARRGFKVEKLCLGSSKALATLSLEESDIACIHLYDPDTDLYNKPFIEKQWFRDQVVYLGGYMRELVFALHPSIDASDLDGFLSIASKLRIACRNRGSGTRMYMEYLFRDIGEFKCTSEHYTHYEVVKEIVEGRADAGLTLNYLAQIHGLKTIHATWEKYECFSLRDRLNREPVKLFRELLSRENLAKYIEKFNGYQLI